jgi:hypothetical protein
MHGVQPAHATDLSTRLTLRPGVRAGYIKQLYKTYETLVQGSNPPIVGLHA